MKVCLVLLYGPIAGPVIGRVEFRPSVFQVEGFDAVLHVVLERGVTDRHAPLTPLETGSVEGFHRVYGPAGEVPVVREGSRQLGKYDQKQTGLR